MAEFVMPALGADMEAGTLIVWLKKPGDYVQRGEVIAEIDTDKGVIEIECFTSGIVGELLVNPGEKVPVGTVLTNIYEEDGHESHDEVRNVPQQPQPSGINHQAGRVKISPLARKLSEKIGIDPKTIKGTGPGGRITQRDVEHAGSSVTQFGSETHRMSDK